MDRLQGLRLFVRVVETGSFSKASTSLGITQPTATKHVAALEQRIGARLFHRSTRGVTPTEIGLLYYEKCLLISRELDEADNLASLQQSSLRGQLRISTSVGFGRRVLVPLVIGFMRDHPDLQVDLSFDDRFVNLVEQGVDVAIRMGKLSDSSLGARYLGLNPWVVVASPDYLALRAAPTHPDELSHHAALIYSTVQGDERWRFVGPDGVSLQVAVQGPLRSNNLSALLAATRAGMGLAALPWYVAQASVASGEVRPVLQQWTLPSQEIHAVFPSPRFVPIKVTKLIGWLQGCFDDRWWVRTT
ncbi:MAG TPA: LysR family transcriptional regulator [Caldimonas sp.]|jgi:DNA-binding transcriptional LysR family regulator|nr:LysR family transcriptional regulator [Caldimonas sp.]